ncbi:F-box/WD repeat-containing protein [Parachlamydia acanthamoebae]|uniref:F-box/WD repeat-containing protein n=1 Tax=Parachlamydia acanthamoebae TaxID=83552 RepID=UPI000751722E|nr:F-box protein [Parachlamydia acanthamoebae]
MNGVYGINSTSLEKNIDLLQEPILLQIPMELIVKILSHLNISSIFATGATCKALKQIICDFEDVYLNKLKTIYRSQFPETSAESKGATAFQYCQAKKLDGLIKNKEIQPKVYKLCPDLLNFYNGPPFLLNDGRIINAYHLNQSNFLQISSLTTLQECKKMDCPSFVLSLDCMQNEIIICGCEKVIHLIELETGHLIRSIPLTCDVWALTHVGQTIIAGCDDGLIRMWDFKTLNEMCELKGHTHAVLSLKVQGHILFSASKDKTIRMWDLSLGTQIYQIERHVCAITCLAISNDKMVSGSLDGRIDVWNWKEKKLLQKIQIENPKFHKINSIALLDGKILSISNNATVFDRPSIFICDLETGVEYKNLDEFAGSWRAYLLTWEGKIICRRNSGTYIYSFAEEDALSSKNVL